MIHPDDLPYPIPEPHLWADEPDPETLRAAEVALADIAAGRSVICTSETAFEILLAELGTDPHAKAS